MLIIVNNLCKHEVRVKFVSLITITNISNPGKKSKQISLINIK